MIICGGAITAGIVDYKDRTAHYNSLEGAQINDNDAIFLQWFMKRYLIVHSGYW